MGGKCPHRHVKKRRYSHKTARRTKFELKGDDAVYDELLKQVAESKPLPVDEDLPGMGQYYCLHCDRYFANVTVRDEHFKTKKHKKRSDTLYKLNEFEGVELFYALSKELDKQKRVLKIMAGPKPHTQLDADLAAGMGMPDNGPKLMSM